jgi:hypothetical protein
LEKTKEIINQVDLLLRQMNAYLNFGTGCPDFIEKKDWESVTSDTERKRKQIELWRKIKEIDPERAEIIKPQNPYVK